MDNKKPVTIVVRNNGKKNPGTRYIARVTYRYEDGSEFTEGAWFGATKDDAATNAMKWITGAYGMNPNDIEIKGV